MSGGLLAGAAALATVLAALVGILNQFGVIGNHEARRNAEVSAPAPIVEEPGSVPGSPVPDEGHSGTGSSVSSLALTKRGNPRILTGAWRDAVGGCHFINQVGSKLEVTNYFPETDDVMSTVAVRSMGLGFSCGFGRCMGSLKCRPTARS